MATLTDVRFGDRAFVLEVRAGVHHDAANEPLYTPLAALVRPGERVLDVGCGNGVLGIVAGLAGAGHVTFVDIDAPSVALALDNARRNGLARVDGAVGDLFEPVRGRGFDLVLCNPPQTGGPPALAARRPDRYGGEDGALHLVRLARAAGEFAPRVLFLHLSRASPRAVAATFAESGFALTRIGGVARRFTAEDLDTLAPGTFAHQLALRARGDAEFTGPDAEGVCTMQQGLWLATLGQPPKAP